MHTIFFFFFFFFFLGGGGGNIETRLFANYITETSLNTRYPLQVLPRKDPAEDGGGVCPEMLKAEGKETTFILLSMLQKNVGKRDSTWSPARCCHSIFKGVYNHDRSATQNLTPISRYFKYIFSHSYPYFAQNGYKLAFKNTPIFRIPSTLLLNHPYFRNFKYTFTKPPLFYKSFIYIFFY